MHPVQNQSAANAKAELEDAHALFDTYLNAYTRASLRLVGRWPAFVPSEARTQAAIEDARTAPVGQIAAALSAASGAEQVPHHASQEHTATSSTSNVASASASPPSAAAAPEALSPEV